jgi:hypothetical protein
VTEADLFGRDSLAAAAQKRRELVSADSILVGVETLGGDCHDWSMRHLFPARGVALIPG